MKRYLLSVILLIFLLKLYPQSFNGGIITGITGTQVSGDQLAGFNKMGLCLGAFVNRNVSPNSSFQMEFKFIQKGSRSTLGIGDTNAQQRKLYLLRLNYIEIPVLYKYDLKGLANRSTDTTSRLLKRLSFEVGAAYGALLGSSELDLTDTYELYSPPFRKSDISFLIGLYFAISENVKFNIRWSTSMLAIRKHNTDPNANPNGFGLQQRINKGQYNDVLEFTLHFQIKSKKEQ